MTKLLTIFTVSALLFSACLIPQTEKTEDQSQSVTVEENETESEEPSEQDEDEGEESLEVELDSEPAADPEYLNYSENTYAELKGNEAFALFFHAEWCPTCRALESDIEENLSSLPAGTKIVKADFDNELDLRKEYGINVQSTVVIVDAEGNKVKTLAAPSAQEVADSLSEVR